MLFILWVNFVLLAVVNNAKVVAVVVIVVIITLLFLILVLSFLMVVVPVAAAAAVHSLCYEYQIPCSKTLLYSCYCCCCHVVACIEKYSISCVPNLPQNTWWSF
jgi:hypothetical protein